MKSNISTHHVWMAWNNCKKIIYFSGGCDLSGRVLFGWFADLGYIKKHYLMSILIGTLSIITCVCINIQSFASYVVLAVAIGIFGKYNSILWRIKTDVRSIPFCSGLSKLKKNTRLSQVEDTYRYSQLYYQITSVWNGCHKDLGSQWCLWDWPIWVFPQC